MAQLEDMRNKASLWPPKDYVSGEDEAEDEKYKKTMATFQELIEELHQLEQDVS